MPSALASQLQKIAAQNKANPQISSKKAQKYKPSYLFTSKEAADYDLDTIYSIGLEGLNELKQENPAFEPFGNTLFSPAIKSVDRTLQVKKNIY